MRITTVCQLHIFDITPLHVNKSAVCKCQFFINLPVSYMPMNNKRTKHIWNILTYMHNLFCLVLCVSFSFYIFIISQDIAIVNTKLNCDCSQILCMIYHYLIYYELHNNVECTNPEYFLNALMKVSKTSRYKLFQHSCYYFCNSYKNNVSKTSFHTNLAIRACQHGHGASVLTLHFCWYWLRRTTSYNINAVMNNLFNSWHNSSKMLPSNWHYFHKGPITLACYYRRWIASWILSGVFRRWCCANCMRKSITMLSCIRPPICQKNWK